MITLGYENSYDVFVKAEGGGLSGQAQAISLGIARALLKVSEDHRVPLRQEGLLTRDSRVVERKKVGLKKARKAPQYSKRWGWDFTSMAPPGVSGIGSYWELLLVFHCTCRFSLGKVKRNWRVLSQGVYVFRILPLSLCSHISCFLHLLGIGNCRYHEISLHFISPQPN